METSKYIIRSKDEVNEMKGSIVTRWSIYRRTSRKVFFFFTSWEEYRMWTADTEDEALALALMYKKANEVVTEYEV